MNPNLFREDMTKILIPKGELLGDFLGLLSRLNLEATEVSSGSLAFTISTLALPLLLVAARARDIGRTVGDPDSEYCFGFTGTDIIAEQGLNNQLGIISPSLLQTRAQIVLGSTPNWNEKVAKPKIENLPENSVVVTPYPNITTSFLQEKGVDAAVVERLGAIESYWWGYPDNTAIVDVRVSGKTMEANRIKPIEVVMDDLTIGLISPSDGDPFVTKKAERFVKDFQVVGDFMDVFSRNARSLKRRS